MPFGDKEALRFFIYWKGIDIDLSATFHDEDFNMIGDVSYTNLKDAELETYHSGDITSASKGACEFIDVTVDAAYQGGARYVVMNVYVYTGPNFSDHEICYAGWMTRDGVNNNEIFDAKTVQQKCDMTQTARNAIPVVFDLKTRRAIWADLITNTRNRWGGNNVLSNRATTEQMLNAIVITTESKVSLYELFALHMKARGGRLVECAEEANTIFAFDEGVTPYDTTVINAEYVV